MKWDLATPAAAQRYEIRAPRILLSVMDDRTRNQRWKYLLLSVGVWGDDSIEECKAQWPAQAFALARKHLDELEQQLTQGETDD